VQEHGWPSTLCRPVADQRIQNGGISPLRHLLKTQRLFSRLRRWLDCAASYWRRPQKGAAAERDGGRPLQWR
jgi:hypothetical protein